jgi:hypothetical protein
VDELAAAARDLEQRYAGELFSVLPTA